MLAFASCRHHRIADAGITARLEAEAYYFQPVDRLHFFVLSSTHFDKACDEIYRFQDFFSINTRLHFISHHNYWFPIHYKFKLNM